MTTIVKNGRPTLSVIHNPEAIKDFKPARKKIVVGIDGSIHSQVALRWAVKYATLLDRAVEVLTVWEYPKMTELQGGIFVQWMPAEDCKEMQAEIIKSLFGANVPKRITTKVRHGNPTKILLSASKNAELLVLGNLGLSGSSGFHLGSVSAACSERSDCTVMIVKGGEET